VILSVSFPLAKAEDFTYLRQFGSYGSGDGQFDNPLGITIGSNETIYVTDQLNDRVEMLDSQGNYIDKFGSNRTGNGQFSFPLDLALGDDGKIFVADSYNYRVQIFQEPSFAIDNPSAPSVYLLLNTDPPATPLRGQEVTFEATVLNQQNPPLQTTLTLTITGPDGYSHYDFQPINVGANDGFDYSFNWAAPNVVGTYVVATGLAPATLTAYDAKRLGVT
jgi:hypothetical protein